MKKQRLVVIILLLIIILIAVAYYIFRISNNTDVADTGNVNVIFEKIGNIEKHNCENTEAFISQNKKGVVITVKNLGSKGAYAIIPVKVKNEGEFSAKLYSIVEERSDKNTQIKVSYDGIGVTDRPLLPGETTSFIVKVELTEDLLDETIGAAFQIKLNYVQDRSDW